MHNIDLQEFIVWCLKAILSLDNFNKCSCVKLRFLRRAHTAVLFIIQLVSCCRNISRLLRKLISLPETCRECSQCQDRSRSTSPPWQQCQKASQACILCDFIPPFLIFFISVWRVYVPGWLRSWKIENVQ